MKKRPMHDQGFTLVEMLVTVVIMLVLIAIAVPSYEEITRNSKRQVALRLLTDIAAKQEAQRTKTRSYAATFDPLLGLTGTTLYVASNGTLATASSDSSIYRIELRDIVTTSGITRSYSLLATAVGKQAKDTACASMGLTSSGIKTASGGANALKVCWEL